MARAIRLGRPQPDAKAIYAVLLEELATRASAFDVIHCHVEWLHQPLLRRLGVPFLTTFHGRLDLPYVATVTGGFPGAAFVSISDSQRQPLPGLNWLGTVYHGNPPNVLEPSFAADGYSAFLGRIVPEKGPETAIRLARAAGRQLRIAAKIPGSQNRYFNRRIAPLLDGDTIEFVGEVDERGKQ